MRILFKSVVLITAIFFLTNCTSEQKVKFWNGEYGKQAAVRDATKKREAYFSSKSPEWMANYKINNIACQEKTNSMPVKYYEQRVAKDNAYNQCMEEKGTPRP